MKIALVLSSPPAYSETFFRSKIKGLQENGHEVVLVTAGSKTNFDLCSHKTHPKVYTNKLKQVFMLFWVAIGLLPYWKRVRNYVALEQKENTAFKRIIEKVYINATLLKLDVNWLHFGFATMAIERELTAKAIGAKMAVSFRGYDINVFPLKNPNVYSKLWRYIDKVHSISEYLLQKAYSLGLHKNTEAQIITPAVDIENLPLRTNQSPSGKLILISVGRLHYIKGMDLLLQTAKILKEQNVDFLWQVIGGGKKADKERYFYHRYELGLEQEVVFLGKRTHKESLEKIVKASIYVQPSLNEGFCNAVLEAQTLGKICIAFNVGALSENIQDNKTGFLVQELAPKKLAQKIQQVYNYNKEEKNKIAQQAQERVKNSFTLQQQKEAFNRFYSI